MMFLYILVYAAAAVFLIAVVWRFVKIASTPMHLRWELYPVAHEGKRAAYGGSYLEESEWWNKPRKKNMIGELAVMIPEIFLLKAVWENNRRLWYFTFCLHHGLYWLIGMAGLMIIRLVLIAAGVNSQGLISIIFDIASVVGTVGYLLGFVGALGVLFLRIIDRGMRDFSSFAAYFNLVFLFLMFDTGIFSILTLNGHFEAVEVFLKGLFTGEFYTLPTAAAVHLTIIVLFALYLPFTHMTHFFTKYFTYHSVRWNDEPNIRGSKLEKSIGKVLQYPVGWSAKHIGADGIKNWGEIATSEVPQDDK
ncbi:MAG: hypothetical protein HQ591_10020 [candidate division Zixibacteria bacterium]|nr:hypothetical protein [Candidatus Tariuqbacter arcticus]